MLQYSSAFDDEVAEVPDEGTAQLSGFPGSILESVVEELPEAMIDAAPEPQPDEESGASQTESGRPSTSVVHGPYYYFYQGAYILLSSLLAFHLPTQIIWCLFLSLIIILNKINSTLPKYIKTM